MLISAQPSPLARSYAPIPGYAIGSFPAHLFHKETLAEYATYSRLHPRQPCIHLAAQRGNGRIRPALFQLRFLASDHLRAQRKHATRELSRLVWETLLQSTSLNALSAPLAPRRAELPGNPSSRPYAPVRHAGTRQTTVRRLTSPVGLPDARSAHELKVDHVPRLQAQVARLSHEGAHNRAPRGDSHLFPPRQEVQPAASSLVLRRPRPER
jgi:hypothetical protein